MVWKVTKDSFNSAHEAFELSVQTFQRDSAVIYPLLDFLVFLHISHSCMFQSAIQILTLDENNQGKHKMQF